MIYVQTQHWVISFDTHEVIVPPITTKGIYLLKALSNTDDCISKI